MGQGVRGHPDRPFHLEAALRRGVSGGACTPRAGWTPGSWTRSAASATSVARLADLGLPSTLSRRDWRRAKRLGFSDAQLAYLWGASEDEVRSARLAAGVRATFKTVDTSAAEFAARTPYHYSTYEDTDEVQPSSRPKVVILGSGRTA